MVCAHFIFISVFLLDIDKEEKSYSRTFKRIFKFVKFEDPASLHLIFGMYLTKTKHHRVFYRNLTNRKTIQKTTLAHKLYEFLTKRSLIDSAFQTYE